LIAALATAGILIGGDAPRPSPPKPETAGVVVVKLTTVNAKVTVAS
jgi:hypothetical protein